MAPLPAGNGQEGAEEEGDLRVLSISSHVVRGYVGNKATTFPLQLLGIEVDPINAVSFSNGTQFSVCEGQQLKAEQLVSLVDGLEANGLLQGYSHLLTGFLGTVEVAKEIAGIFDRMRAVNPDVTFLCDPVLGDDGEMYCDTQDSRDLVALYRDTLVPLATTVVPNGFEAELLTGISIRTRDDVQRTARALHALGPETVVITSAHTPESGTDSAANSITTYASRRCHSSSAAVGISSSSSSSRGEQGGSCPPSPPPPSFDTHEVKQALYPVPFTGTGDLMAALLLAWFARMPNDLRGALERVCATLRAVVGRTFEALPEWPLPLPPVGSSLAPPPSQCELLLVQSRHDIEHPPLL